MNHDDMMQMTRDQATDQAADRARWRALYVLCAGVLMIVLDATIVNVALPSIQDDLGFSQTNLAWVVNAYLIAFGGLLLLAGRLGDLVGRRRVFLIGLVLFTAASLACALAPTQGVLIVARFAQGVGGALTSAVVLGMVVTMFPEPREQAKAIGIYGFVASAGGSIGLLAGGVITDLISWHWIFFVNLPIGIAAIVFTRKHVVDDAGVGVSAGADVPGTVLITAGLMLNVYTILQIEHEGWGSARTLGGMAVSYVLIGLFLARQTRVATPLMPLRLFRSRNVTGANLVMAFLVAGMFTQFFLGALYMQRVLDYTPLQVGLAFFPGTLIMGILSLRYAERAMMRFGARPMLFPALLCIGGGLLLLARTPVDGTYVADLLAPTVLISIGAGLAFPPLMTLAMSGASPNDAGLASGLINTTVQVGGAIGLAVLATLATERTQSRKDDGASEFAALVSGYHLGYVVGAALCAVALAVAAFVLQKAALPSHGAPVDDAESAEPAVALTV